MNAKYYIELAENILAGTVPDTSTLTNIARTPDADVFNLLPGASLLRNAHSGNTVHLCNICNGKSGRCSENCRFCSQSAFSQTDAPVYPLLSADALKKGAEYTARTPIRRYSVVTSGRGLPGNEVELLAAAFAEMPKENARYCASLGILAQEELEILKNAGVGRYHHNLETARSHFDAVCSTHSYDERMDTIRAAQAAGMSVCAGGIFGIGESDDQVLELALTLRELDVDAVPLNFLVPIPGTPLSGTPNLTPLRCLKIISLFRYVLPEKDILVCGGRPANLKSLQSLIFQAGASGMMTGNYLTTTGRTLDDDLDMIAQLGMVPLA